MEAAEIDRELGELEGKVEQLRSLYEQYFMGFDRLEPLVQRRDVERRVSALRREQIRNTAQRFKFNVLVQRLNTMQQHWARVVREIENGTYKRDVVRAAARFGDGALSALGKKKAKGLAAAIERAQARQGPAKEKAEEAFELEADDLIEEAEDALPPEPTAPPPQPPPPAPQATSPAPATGKGAAPLPATLGLGLLSRLSAGAKKPEAAQPALTPTKPLIPSPTTPKIPPQPATPAAPSLAAPSPAAASPAAPSPAAPAAAPSPAAPSPLTRPAHLAPKPVVPTKPAAPAIPKVAAPAASAPAPAPKPATPQPPVPPPAPPVARPVAPPAPPAPPAPRVTMRGDPPSPPARPAARPPAPAPQPVAGGAAGKELPEQRIQQIYATYIDAKRSTQESTAGITYDKLAQSLRTQADRLQSAHPSKTVDYEVVVKDGKTHLKPVLR